MLEKNAETVITPLTPDTGVSTTDITDENCQILLEIEHLTGT